MAERNHTTLKAFGIFAAIVIVVNVGMKIAGVDTGNKQAQREIERLDSKSSELPAPAKHPPKPVDPLQGRIDAEAGSKPGEGLSVPWYAVDDYLRANLKDPDSLKYGDTWGPSLVTLSDGRYAWRVKVNYRARNSFGGYAVESAVAYIQHDKVIRWDPSL